MIACKVCGWTDDGVGWGYVKIESEAAYVDGCDHIHGARQCDYCDELWFRVGNDSTWDLAGDSTTSTKCEAERCPDCCIASTCDGPGDSRNGCDEIGTMTFETYGDWPANWPAKLRVCESCHKAMTARKNKAAAREEI